MPKQALSGIGIGFGIVGEDKPPELITNVQWNIYKSSRTEELHSLARGSK